MPLFLQSKQIPGTPRRLLSVLAYLATVLGCALAGCGSDDDAAPPLDVRGVYEASWSVTLRDADLELHEPDSSEVRGQASGTVIVSETDGGMMIGSFVMADTVQAPFQPVVVAFSAAMERKYFAGDDPIDYGWDLTIVSRVDGIIGCTYFGPAPGNSPGIYGEGRIDPEMNIDLAFGGIYDCESGRRRVIMGAHGARVSNDPGEGIPDDGD